MSSIYWRLLTFLKPYNRQVLFVWVIVAAAAAFTMIQPKLLQWAVDTGMSPQGNTAITADVTDSATLLPVKSADGLGAGDIIRIRREKLKITDVSGTDLHVERGVDNTEPQVLSAGSRVSPQNQRFGGKTNTLIVAALAIIGAAAMRGFFTYWQTFLGEWLGQHVAFDLRNQIYEKLQRLSYAYHDKQQTGQLMSRATQDVEATRMFIQMGALRLLDMGLRVSIAGVAHVHDGLAAGAGRLGAHADRRLPLDRRDPAQMPQDLDRGPGTARPHYDGPAGEPRRRARRQGLLARGLRRGEVQQGSRRALPLELPPEPASRRRTTPFYQAMGDARPGCGAAGSAP